MPHDRVFHGGVVLHEIVRPQDGRGQIAVLDHALHRMFSCKMRDIRKEIGVENRQVDDALDAGFPGEAESEQRLREFVGRDGIEQEQRACLRDGLSSRLDVHEVGLHRQHAGRKLSLFGQAGHGVNVGVFRCKIGDNARSDNACAAGYENSHGSSPRLFAKFPVI